MGRLRLYDRAGVGFDMRDDFLIGPVEDQGTFRDGPVRDLGDGRSSQQTTVTGNPVFDTSTAFALKSNGNVFLTGLTASEGGDAVFEMSGVRADLDVPDGTFTAAVLRGNDQITGNRFADRISGFAGYDTLFGKGGNDTLSGNQGRDTLFGGVGRDSVAGGSGDDRLYGNRDNDRLDGGHGNDRLTGGFASDTFVFRAGDGRDTITDFRNGIDRIEIRSGADNFGQLRITDPGDDVLITFGDVQIRLQDVYSSYIGPEDFLFT